MIMRSQPQLLELIQALHAPGSLARRLHRREQKCDKNSDDRDDHQKFHQGESAMH
jgi:hypothetical protein